MKRFLCLLLLLAASGARGQALKIVDIVVPDSVRLVDGAASAVPVAIRVYRGGVVCVTVPCPQAPPRHSQFRLAIEIDSTASASVRAERTFRAHSSHTLTLPLTVDLTSHSPGSERMLWGTVRLFQEGAAVACRRFRIVVNAPEARRLPPLAHAEWHCDPSG